MTRVYLQDTELTGGAGSNISIEDLRKHLAPYTDGDTEYLLSGYQDGYTYQYIFWAGPKKEFIPLPPGALFEYLPDDKTDPNFGKCFLNMGHGLVDVTGLLSVSWNDIIDKPDFDSYQTADQVSQTIQDALSDLDISGFLKRIDLTESEYAALETKDHDTVYVVEEDEPEPPLQTQQQSLLAKE